MVGFQGSAGVADQASPDIPSFDSEEHRGAPEFRIARPLPKLLPNMVRDRYPLLLAPSDQERAVVEPDAIYGHNSLGTDLHPRCRCDPAGRRPAALRSPYPKPSILHGVGIAVRSARPTPPSGASGSRIVRLAKMSVFRTKAGGRSFLVIPDLLLVQVFC